MKKNKYVLLLLCLGMVLCGFAYYQETFANSAAEPAPEGQGISQQFTDRYNASVNKVTIFPAVYDADFDPTSDKEKDGYWDSSKIVGAQDQLLKITNNGATPCYFRTYIAFENSGGIFDDVVVNWAAGFKVDKVGELTIEGEPHVVFAVTFEKTEETIGSSKSITPLLQLYLKSHVTSEDARAQGGEYSVRAATDAAWIPAAEYLEHDTELISFQKLLGDATLDRAKTLLTK